MGKVRLLAASLMAAAAGFAAAQNRVPPGSNPYPFGVPAVQSRPATPPQPINPGHVQAAKNTPAQPPQQQLAYVPVYFVDPYWGDYGYGYWYPHWWRHGYTYLPVYCCQGPGSAAGSASRAAAGQCRSTRLPARGTSDRRCQSRPSPSRPIGGRPTPNRPHWGGSSSLTATPGLPRASISRRTPDTRCRPEAAQLADAYFRQGFALAAMGSYSPAVKAIQRGLAIDPRWPDSPFQLDDLYGPNAAAKRHICTARRVRAGSSRATPTWPSCWASTSISTGQRRIWPRNGSSGPCRPFLGESRRTSSSGS